MSFPTGAYHAAEILSLFNYRRGLPVVFSLPQRRLAQAMADYWTTFAATGDPNSPRTPPWPAYDRTAQRFQSLRPGVPVTATGFAADHRCSLYE